MKFFKNSRFLLPTIVLAIVLTGATFWAASKVQANGNGQNMASDLASKLNISQDQVQTAMDSIKSDRQAERQKEVSANLDKAVTDGVITAEQKQKILDRQTEMAKKREQERADNEKWQTESGIDFSKLRSYGVGKMGMGGMGKGRGIE